MSANRCFCTKTFEREDGVCVQECVMLMIAHPFPRLGWLRQKTLSIRDFPLSLLFCYSLFSQHWAAFGISSCFILIAYSFVLFYCNFHCLLPRCRGNTEPECLIMEFGSDSFSDLPLILNWIVVLGPIYISKRQGFWLSMFVFSWTIQLQHIVIQWDERIEFLSHDYRIPNPTRPSSGQWDPATRHLGSPDNNA